MMVQRHLPRLAHLALFVRERSLRVAALNARRIHQHVTNTAKARKDFRVAGQRIYDLKSAEMKP
ncbi:hypothetical protein V1291_005168 [Nitrobacteraceae bacterium AZCC 1564]